MLNRALILSLFEQRSSVDFSGAMLIHTSSSVHPSHLACDSVLEETCQIIIFRCFSVDGLAGFLTQCLTFHLQYSDFTEYGGFLFQKIIDFSNRKSFLLVENKAVLCLSLFVWLSKQHWMMTQSFP